MDHSKEIKSVRVIFFSGTGGTRRIAEGFERELKNRGLDVTVRNLGASLQEKKNYPEEQEVRAVDLNILVYPVYAMDAAKPVYDWIETVSGSEAGEKIAVFSVSGGGQMWPNNGCRVNCINALEKRGFQVAYDRMMCMPANVLAEMGDHAIMWLIRSIPKKISAIVDELLAGKTHRTHFRKGPVMNWFSRSERENAHKIARGFIVTEACTSCGWCVRNCPTLNIEIPEPGGKPRFLEQCVFCTRCLNCCPTNAIKAKGPFQLKHSLDLDAIEKRMEGVELQPVEKCCKGLVFKGVRDYLLDKY